MAGPALAYLGAAYFMVDNFSDYSNGWAIPCATDIAFSYLVARIVFGGGHPAIPFLLLLAIVDDALGLIILAVFYPQGEMAIHFMILPIIAIGIGLMMRKKGIKSFWPYLLGPGVISWCGFALSGLHPALGLLPIIPTLPHASSDKGLFNWEEMNCHDTLNEFEHWWKNPVEIVLGLFGLLNAGVVMESVGPATTFVLLGLFVGKPIGIWLCGVFASSVLGFGLPEGMGKRDPVLDALPASDLPSHFSSLQSPSGQVVSKTLRRWVRWPHSVRRSSPSFQAKSCAFKRLKARLPVMATAINPSRVL